MIHLNENLKNEIQPIKRNFLGIGIFTGIATVWGYLNHPGDFAPAYLTSFLFWLGITLGSLPVVFIHCLTGGGWGFPVRRILENAAKLVPLMFLLAIPIYLQRHELYEWMDPDVVAHDYIIQKKQLYLNETGFVIRALVYFVIWGLLAFFLNRWSVWYDRDNNPPCLDKWLQALGGSGIILYALTITYSSVDWAMSLEPHWFSTIYGVTFMVGNALLALGFSLFLFSRMGNQEPLKTVMNESRSHDLGTLLFAFVMLWAYIAVSQFIIIWSGNLQEEAPWYMRRIFGGWDILIIFIVLFHFLIPFFVLLIRKNKQKVKLLGWVGFGLLIVHYLDLFWHIKPVFYETISVHWLDATSFLAIGSFWIYTFLKLIQRNPVVFKTDPIHKEAPGHH